MRTHTIVTAAASLILATTATGQALTLTAATASGDCAGTSFHQAADASGRYLAAEWAGASQFPIVINRGRVRCSIRFVVTVPNGYKFVPGGGQSTATRLAWAQLSPLRLNGAASGVMMESSIAIEGGAAAVATTVLNGGAMTMATVAQDRTVASSPIESACSSAAKSSFQVTAAVDVAAASNYVVPWPPEPYANRETASVSMYRLFYAVVPCGSQRSAAIEGAVLRWE